ncbi:hypothetical protein [Streptomyces sp. S063]|uniref:hypothetical protein n=1 Tax=Streptomyces sp. S063 TaxID=2005885 RepID=UPI001F1C1631|nr:hypothetical protein [Streptomyces sp. S063]
MDEHLLEAVRSLAERISTRALAYRTAGKPFDAALMARPTVQLAMLRSLHEARRSVDRLAESAATVADAVAPATRSSARPGAASSASRPPQVAPAVPKKSAGESIRSTTRGATQWLHHDPGADAWWYTPRAPTAGKRIGGRPRHVAEAIARATEFLLTHARPAERDHVTA